MNKQLFGGYWLNADAKLVWLPPRSRRNSIVAPSPGSLVPEASASSAASSSSTSSSSSAMTRFELQHIDQVIQELEQNLDMKAEAAAGGVNAPVRPCHLEDLPSEMRSFKAARVLRQHKDVELTPQYVSGVTRPKPKPGSSVRVAV